MAKQIGNPELMDTWGSEGNVSEPFLTKKRQGWLFQEQPASSIANWLVNTQQQKINHLLKNGVSEWSINTDYTRGACVKYANTAWKALRDNTASEPAPGNEDWAEISTLPLIRRPNLISPIDGESDVSTSAPLVASEYAAVYSSDVRDYRRFEVDVSGGDFSSPVATNDLDADDWTVDPALTIDTGYIWRCKDVSVRGDESEWSDVEGFVTGSVFVTTPSITAPADNAVEIGETPTFTSSAFAVTGGSDTHVASYWRVFQGSTEVWATGRTTSDLESITIPSGILQDGETEYTVQVKHEGDTYGSSGWSAASTFTTLDSFVRVAQPSITSPANNETDIGEKPTFTSSAFSVIGGSDTHIASAWEVYTTADALVWSSGRDTANRTSITMPGGILEDGETGYKVRVRHEGDVLSVSEWSETVAFVTELNFPALFSSSRDGTLRKINNETMTQDASDSREYVALAYGSDDFLYASRLTTDGTDNQFVFKIDPADIVSPTEAVLVANNGATLQPHALAYGADGFVYVGLTDRLTKIDPSPMGVVDDLLLTQVYALTTDDSGFVFVSIAGKVIKIDGSSMTQSAAEFTITSVDGVPTMCFGTDGFLYFSEDEFVRKIDPSDMTQSAAFQAGTGVDFHSAAFGSDGFLYMGDDTGSVRKINPSTMSQVAVFNGLTDHVDAIVFGDDGFLYAGDREGADSVIKRIDPSDMTEVGSFTGHTDHIRDIAFTVSIPKLLGFTA